MYNIKGPSKFVAKTTRRGMQQNIENLRDLNKNKSIESENDFKNGPKPVFNKKTSPTSPKHKTITPQHEEIINFIHNSWNSVCAEFEHDTISNEGEHSVCYYEEEPCISLQDFKPFDLESWWGKRLYAYVTNSTNQKT